MKIFFNHYLPDADHPSARMVEQLGDELRSLGHDVLIHGSDLQRIQPKTNAKDESGSSQWLAAKISEKTWFVKAMLRNRTWRTSDRAALHEFCPDIVLSRQDAYCWSVVEAAGELNIPCVTFAEAPVAFETRTQNVARRWHPKGLLERIEHWGLSQSESVITISNPAKIRLEKYLMTTPVWIAPMGVKLERFPKYSQHEIDRVKQDLGVAGKTVLAYRGSFEKADGIDRIHEMMTWSSKFNNLVWVLIGDGPEKARLQSAIAGTVAAKFIGGGPTHEIDRLLSAIDIAIVPQRKLPAEYYFCPAEILEWAASGCAIIASRQGDIPILLAHGKGGHIVSDDRKNSWTHGLQQLIQDTSYRSKLGDIARDHIQQHYSMQRTATNFEKVLADALGTKVERQPSSPTRNQSDKSIQSMSSSQSAEMIAT